MSDAQAVPQRYRSALERLFEIPPSEERAFVARGWINKRLSAKTDMPTPVAWLLTASNIDAATAVSAVIRDVFNGLAEDEQDGSIDAAGIAAVQGFIAERVLMLDLNDAQRVLDDLGIPLYYNPVYHEFDRVTIIPFMEEVGFSDDIICDFIGLVPNRIVE